MIEGIDASTLTPSVLLGIFVLLIFLGVLVPYRSHRETVSEAERWRKAYESEREARALSDAQTTELLEVTKTTRNLLVALHGTAEKIRGSGGTDEMVPTTQTRE